MLNSDELFDQAHQHLLLFGYKIQYIQVFHVAQFHCTNFPFFGTQEHIVTECLRVNKLELISRFPFVVNALSKCLRLDMPVPTDVNLTLRRCYELILYHSSSQVCRILTPSFTQIWEIIITVVVLSISENPKFYLISI